MSELAEETANTPGQALVALIDQLILEPAYGSQHDWKIIQQEGVFPIKLAPKQLFNINQVKAQVFTPEGSLSNTVYYSLQLLEDDSARFQIETNQDGTHLELQDDEENTIYDGQLADHLVPQLLEVIASGLRASPARRKTFGQLQKPELFTPEEIWANLDYRRLIQSVIDRRNRMERRLRLYDPDASHWLAYFHTDDPFIKGLKIILASRELDTLEVAVETRSMHKFKTEAPPGWPVYGENPLIFNREWFIGIKGAKLHLSTYDETLYQRPEFKRESQSELNASGLDLSFDLSDPDVQLPKVILDILGFVNDVLPALRKINYDDDRSG